MQLPQVIETNGIRVLTTKQIAEAYGVKEVQISQNFKNNRNRFVEGKHYISLSGDELRAFKKHFEKIELVNNRASHLYLWTEKGALLHAKSLNTDKAWEVYEYLIDFYFRVKEEPQQREVKKNTKIWEYVDAPENPAILNAIKKLQDDLVCMNVLLEECKNKITLEEYKRKRMCTAEMIYAISRDMADFLRIEPKLIN